MDMDDICLWMGRVYIITASVLLLGYIINIVVTYTWTMLYDAKLVAEFAMYKKEQIRKQYAKRTTIPTESEHSTEPVPPSTKDS